MERGYFWTSAASVENGNPLFWDDAVADEITDGPVAPLMLLSAWFRPHHWAPGRTVEKLPLQIHFDLKARFELPEAIMTENTTIFHEPVRPGDMITSAQRLVSVSEELDRRLGTGRFWMIDVEYRNQRGELCRRRERVRVRLRLPRGRHRDHARRREGRRRAARR